MGNQGFIFRPKHPTCRMSISANQTIVTGTWTKLLFNQTSTNFLGWADIANNEIKALNNLNCYFAINIFCRWGMIEDIKVNTAIRFKVEGDVQSTVYSYYNRDNRTTHCLSDIVYLYTNEKLSVEVWHNRGADYDLQGQASGFATWLTFYRIS